MKLLKKRIKMKPQLKNVLSDTGGDKREAEIMSLFRLVMHYTVDELNNL